MSWKSCVKEQWPKTSWFVTQGQKRVDYIWVPEILMDDWVHKRHTKLNMLPVFIEQIRSLCRKLSKFNFWIRLHSKSALSCRLLTQISTWQQNHIIFTSSVKAILKAMTDTVYFGPSLGVVRILFFMVGGFFNKREYSKNDYPYHLLYVLTTHPFVTHPKLDRFITCPDNNYW